MKNLLKQSAITAGLEAISRLRLAKLFPRMAGRGLIFTLHHVRPKNPLPFEPNGHLSVTPDFLEATVEEGLRAGLTPVALEDLPARLADPADRRRFMAFTLDDGYRDNRDFAAPIFRRHGIPYTIFVTPGFVERQTTMWWETLEALLNHRDSVEIDLGTGPQRVVIGRLSEKIQLFDAFCNQVNGGDQDGATERINAAALKAGIDPMGIIDREIMTEAELRALAAADPLIRFGGHTLTHPVLPRVSPERLAREIGESMRMATLYGGREAVAFAYPYGIPCAIGPREFEAARQAGVKIGVTTRPGVLTEDTFAEPMAVRRVSLNGLYQKRHYVGALISGIPFRLRG